MDEGIAFETPQVRVAKGVHGNVSQDCAFGHPLPSFAGTPTLWFMQAFHQPRDASTGCIPPWEYSVPQKFEWRREGRRFAREEEQKLRILSFSDVVRRPTLAAMASKACCIRWMMPRTRVERKARHLRVFAGTQDGTGDVLKTLQMRGLVETTTGDEALQLHCKEKRVRVYCGFDPTADSLHLGNLLGIVVLSWFQRYGHEPVALMGGATGRVGDPSGKSMERPLLDEEELENNIKSIGNALNRIMGSEVKLVNNLDWFGDMGFLEFLRKVGRYARIGTMTAKDSVKSRINSEQGMSFAEFSYQLLQGYDFVHLMENEDVTVQIGGSDQWGNITAGTDLIRKMLRREGAHGLTFPLLVGSDGKKYGKSEGGAIWLNSDRLSPFKFYQYLYNTPDADVIRFTKMLTFLPLEEVSALEQSMSDPSYVPNTAQKKLAEEVTRFVHGEAGLAQALEATESLRPGSDTQLNASALESIADDVPCVVLEKAQLVGKQLTDVLVSAGLQPSRSAAKRMIKGGGIRLNNVKVVDDSASIADSDLLDGRLLLLAAGKKNKMLVRVGDDMQRP